MCSLVQSVSIQPPDSTTLKAEWDTITVEYSQVPPGEKNFSFSSNVISIVLAPQRSTWCLDGVSSTVAIPPGSICLYSVPQIWWQWEKPAKSLHVTLADSLLTKVATDFSISGKIDLEHRLVFTDPTILNISFMLKSEVENGGIAGKLYTESLANVLAVHLLRNYSEVVVPKLEDGPLNTLKLNQVKDFIEDRLAEDLTVADMATVVYMSQFHFARAFKAATGTPPHRYLTFRRMERAKVLLSVTRLSVAEVAYRVGFDNKSHFIAQFRKATGTTPKAFRDSF